MTEEFPTLDIFYAKPPDLPRPNQNVNVITKDPNGKRINVKPVFDQRRIEHEKLTQTSLPSLKNSYGTIYSPRSYYSESDPLIGSLKYDRCQPYLCGEPIRLTRYRRNQIFLFFYIVFYVGYLIIGSIIFQKLEISHEQKVRDEFRVDRQDFKQKYPYVKGVVIYC